MHASLSATFVSLALASTPVFAQQQELPSLPDPVDLSTAEQLTPPVDLELAPGSGIVAAGGGMFLQPSFLSLHVPVGSQVVQVLAYWQGLATTARTGDDTALINGFEVQGTQIGESTLFYKLRGVDPRYSIAYRADITQLGFIRPGNNFLFVDGIDFETTNGFGVIAVYDDGSTAHIDLREGTDNAFADFRPPLDTTVAQTFAFEASDITRHAEVLFFVGGVAPESRPSAISVAYDDAPAGILFNRVRSRDYLEWDTYVLPLQIPAGTSRVTVRLLSTPELPPAKPASLTWITAVFSMKEPIAECDGSAAFWANYAELWSPGGPHPMDSLSETFTTQLTTLLPFYDDLLGDLSLNEVLVAPAGVVPIGPARELFREATAALVNASSPNHSMPHPPAVIVDAVNIILSINDVFLMQLATDYLRAVNAAACASEQEF